jgi:hypothetical protein
MAKASQEPPSPVDAYEAPPIPVDAGSPPPPYAPAGYSQQAYGQQAYGQQPYGQPIYAASRPTNVLAIIALIASGAGLIIPGAMIAGVIMGHISLSQIKRTGEGGHGLALAAVIVGYALFAIEFLAIVAYIVFIVIIIGAASSSVNDFNSSDFG